MRISDWSSDVCSSDLDVFLRLVLRHGLARPVVSDWTVDRVDQIAKGLFLLRRIVLGHRGHGHAASLVTHGGLARGGVEIGRAHVWTPVTNAHLVCRLLLENKTSITATAPVQTY